MEQIQAHTREGSLYYTDEWQAYATLRLRGEHVMIRHSPAIPKAPKMTFPIANQPLSNSSQPTSQSGATTSTVSRGFWSYAKNWLYPYRGVSQKHFHLYLGEVCFRFNHRDQDIKPLLTKLFKKTNFNKISQF